MLPDIRAVVAAVFAAIALLAVSFGVAATFRVAQESRTGSLQADLARRSRIRRLRAPGLFDGFFCYEVALDVPWRFHTRVRMLGASPLLGNPAGDVTAGNRKVHLRVVKSPSTR